MSGRPDKIETKNLFEEIEQCISSKNYLFTEHGKERSKQRKVNQEQVLKILSSSDKFHEKKKDSFDVKYNTWNYSIRGETIDKEKVRIIISFDEELLLVITVINLSKT